VKPESIILFVLQNSYTHLIKNLSSSISLLDKIWREVKIMAKSRRGFASMDRDVQSRIAAKGGRAAHRKGTAHEWTSEEAKRAGRKGGRARQGKRSDDVIDEDLY